MGRVSGSFWVIEKKTEKLKYTEAVEKYGEDFFIGEAYDRGEIIVLDKIRTESK